MAIISDDAFRSIVERMLQFGGEWRVSMSDAGNVLTYAGQTHEISEKHADVMFTCIPRKAADAPAPRGQ